MSIIRLDQDGAGHIGVALVVMAIGAFSMYVLGTDDPTVALVAAFAVAIVVIAALERTWRARQLEMGAANAMLDHHLEAFEQIVRHDDLSNDGRTFLLQVEALFATRSLARNLVESIFDHQDQQPISPALVRVLEEFDAYGRANPDFKVELKTFLDTGLYAMTLRWPETRGDYIRITVCVESEGLGDLTRTVGREVRAWINDRALPPQVGAKASDRAMALV